MSSQQLVDFIHEQLNSVSLIDDASVSLRLVNAQVQNSNMCVSCSIEIFELCDIHHIHFMEVPKAKDYKATKSETCGKPR